MIRVFVGGTGTEVGKTWWAAATLRALRAQGCRVAARKPAQSYDPADETTDAAVLAAASGERPEDVCPPHRWYERALAPPMAAAALGRDVPMIAELAAELLDPRDADVVLIEGAGGPRSPLASDGDNVAFARAAGAGEILLVADAGLGTINAVRLSVAAFDPVPVVVALNRFGDDAVHEANRRWLTERDGFEVVTDPAVLAGRWAKAVSDP